MIGTLTVDGSVVTVGKARKPSEADWTSHPGPFNLVVSVGTARKPSEADWTSRPGPFNLVVSVDTARKPSTADWTSHPCPFNLVVSVQNVVVLHRRARREAAEIVRRSTYNFCRRFDAVYSARKTMIRFNAARPPECSLWTLHQIAQLNYDELIYCSVRCRRHACCNMCLNECCC